VIQMANLDELMKEMEDMEKEKKEPEPLVSVEEKQRRLVEVRKIKVLLVKVGEGEEVPELSFKERREIVEVEGKKRSYLRGFHFSITEMDQGVDKDGQWKQGIQVLLDERMAQGQKWAAIRFAPATFVCEVYRGAFPISDNEVVELLSAVPIEGGVIDNFKTFERYVQWYLTKYIEGRRKMQKERQKSNNVFQRILRKP